MEPHTDVTRLSEQRADGKISPGRGPSYIPSRHTFHEPDERPRPVKMVSQYNLRSKGPAVDKDRRRAFGTPTPEPEGLDGGAVEFFPKFVGVESAKQTLENPISSFSQGRTTGEEANFVGADREAIAQQLCEKIRHVDSEKERLVREYYDFVDQTENVINLRTTYPVRVDYPRVEDPRDSETQTRYFHTPTTEVMNLEREFTVPQVTTVFTKERETPHRILDYRSMGDCHPHSQLSSRLADASLLTPRLVLVPESRSIRVSSGKDRLEATREVGFRATIQYLLHAS